MGYRIIYNTWAAIYWNLDEEKVTELFFSFDNRYGHSTLPKSLF